MKTLSMLLLLTGLVGCMKGEGTLKLYQNLQMVKNPGLGKKMTTISKGTYNAKLVVQKKKIVIKLKSGGKNLTIRMKAPANLKEFPRDGKVSLSPSQLGQPFGAFLKFDYDYDSQYAGSGTQSCIHHYDYHTECGWEDVCVTSSTGERICETQHVCHEVSTPVYGSQDYDDYDWQKDYYYNFSILKSGSTVGKFNAHEVRTGTDRQTGACFL